VAPSDDRHTTWNGASDGLTNFWRMNFRATSTLDIDASLVFVYATRETQTPGPAGSVTNLCHFGGFWRLR